MKTKYFFIAAIAAVGLISCADDAFIAEAPPVNNVEENGMAPILFSSSQSAFTRADYVDADAADLLNNMFVVTGFKGAATATPGSIVFDNYKVTYEANTANTTASNSSNWEYVGNAPIYWAADNGITSQTIKYWDYSKDQYDFIAWGMGKVDVSGTLTEITPIYDAATTDLAAQTVRVSAIVPNSKNKTWPTAADPAPANLSYTFEGAAKDLAHCYISDIVTVKKSGAGQYGEVEGYGQPVTLKFRQLGTKVRIALYETIPGYSVKNVEFYSAAASNDASAASAKIFTTTANQIFTEGKYYVYFPTMDTPDNPDNNQAHIKFTAKTGTTQATTVDWGRLNYTGRQEAEKGDAGNFNIYLGRTSNTASFAGKAADNYYVFYLPNEDGTNLNLRVNYTLESIDGSGEEIVVRGATAQVPSIYTTWKPGYAYTYLFKISDKTNGYTGVYDPLHPDDTTINSDPAGLYPITFDAIVVNAEDGNYTQETITLVSAPSITTYQNGSKVVNNNEYTFLSPSGKITGEIYVTVNDGEATYEEVSKTAGESVAGLYTNPSTDVYTPCAADAVAVDGTKYYKMLLPSLDTSNLATLTGKVALYTVADGTTEAQVIDALQYQEDDKASYTIKGRNGVGLTEPLSLEDLDGNSTLDDKLLVVTDEVTYGVDGNSIDVSTGKAAKFVPVASTTYAFVYTKQASTDETPMYEPRSFSGTGTKYRYVTTAVAAASDVQKNVVYVKPTTGIQPVFLGQGVGNLYTNNSGTATPTTEYASTGTTYYYKDGSTYKEAHKVAYADFATATLYVKSGAYFVTKTETEPVDGTAYYYQTGAGTDADPYVYTYCVIYPEQTATTWFTVDTNSYVEVGGSEAEISGMTYFDMYTKNNGVYYTKIIKVQ
ncbi:MAG: hypothetical protein IJ887_05010 [Prevotella sp.]|nr:hypothetical protein [Prevotella sp.]